MSSLANAKALLTDLNGKVNSGDVAGGLEILSKLKILMLDFPVTSQMTDEQVSVATSALELGILLSVADGDFEAFGRNVSQVKPYYNARPSPASAVNRKCHIWGLNLMHLLLDNRLSEFHAELELLSAEEAASPFISFPITLERQLMVGSYDEVLNASVPDPSYQLFVDNLLQTVRDSIADCMEVSYKTMKLSDAVTMMRFSNTDELQSYMEDCRDDWIVQDDVLCFQPPPSGSKASDIPSMKLIAQSLTYATELERIV